MADGAPTSKTATKTANKTPAKTSTKIRAPKIDLRDPEVRRVRLAELRNQKMARSAHAFVRGSTDKFYEWLDSSEGQKVPEGPPVWICGDCHSGNLGPIANAKGRVAIQIRDLDQTVIGNPAHDLIRLALSLASAARGSDLPGVMTARMVEQLIDGYEAAFTDEAADSDVNPPPSVREALRSAMSRKWRHLAEERFNDRRAMLPLGRRFWPLAKTEWAEIEALFADEKVRRLVTSLKSRDDNANVELIDAAYWVKGCSSLGLLRYAVLLRVGAKGGDYCLIDIKEARKAVAPRYPQSKMPRANAERVVEGAWHLSPNLGDRMLAASIGGKSVFVRELLPQDLKLELAHLDGDEATIAARYLAHVVGRAHARQMSTEERASWRSILAANRSGKLEAPSWLWTSVVELMANHEAAYLEHCRRYALQPPT